MEILGPGDPQQKMLPTAIDLYQRVHDTWGATPPYTMEQFAALPEQQQTGILGAIQHINPGYWMESVVGVPALPTNVIPESVWLRDTSGDRWHIHVGNTVTAEIPRIDITTSEGIIKI